MNNKRAILLLSGGFDSPVAAHMMQEKGFEIVALHFYNQHLGDEDTLEKCRKICERLDIDKLYAVPFDQQQAEIARECKHKYFYLITRRLMWRVAEKLAEKENASFLLNGENLAQVASQTLSNLTTTQEAVSTPILRPLLCFDKMEIIEKAKKIGTFEISKGPEVCSLLGPKHPAITSDVGKVKMEEGKINISDMVESTFKRLEIVERDDDSNQEDDKR